MKHIEFIELLGGTSKVAGLCGISKGAVSQWKKTVSRWHKTII